MDKKLRPQIDRLLKVPAGGVAADGADQNDADQNDADAASVDLTPTILSRSRRRRRRRGRGGDEVYKAPRMVATPYEPESGGKAARAERRAARRAERLKKSKILKELREEMSERPEELREAVTGNAEQDEEEAERRRYEEENFTRLQLTKEQRARARKARSNRLPNAFQELTDFGDSELLFEQEAAEGRASASAAAASAEAAASASASLQGHVNRIEQRRARRRGAERVGVVRMEDPEEAEARRRSRNQAAAAAEADADDEHYSSGYKGGAGRGGTRARGGSSDFEDDFYHAQKVAAAKRKRSRARPSRCLISVSHPRWSLQRMSSAVRATKFSRTAV